MLDTPPPALDILVIMMEWLSAAFASVITACAAAGPSASLAQEPTEAQVRQLLDSEIERATRFDVPPSIVVRWTQEDYNTLNSEEVASLRAEVAGKPYHPKRILLENAEVRIRDGKQSVHMFWLSDERGRWRFGLEYPGTLVSDTVYDPLGQSWQRGNGTLKLFRSQDVEKGGTVDQDPKAEEMTFRPAIDRILFGSLGANSALGVRLQSVRFNGSSWEALFFLQAESVRIGEMTVRGRWSGDHERIFVEQVQYARPREPGQSGDRVLFRGWTFFPDSGLWAATDVQFLDGLGRLERRYTGVDVRVLSATEVREALAVPAAGTIDNFRGTVRLARRLDFNAGKDERLDPETGTATESRPLRGKHPQQPIDHRRLLGWIVLSVIGVIASLLIGRRLGLRITGGGS